MNAKRETWLDNVKLLACILVVCGHLFQSMVGASIIPETSLYRWFVNTIYSFHVPLFFVCSGYLYQKTTCTESFASWLRNLRKKLIILGIPYVVFSSLTWLLKAVFSETVNNPNDKLISSLFFRPISPYWYLYVLFFLFALFPTFISRKKLQIVWMLTMVIKCLVCVFNDQRCNYIITKIMDNGVWFVSGMVLNTLHLTASLKCRNMRSISLVCLSSLLATSIVLHVNSIFSELAYFALGIIGTVGIITFFISCERDILPEVLLKNTMPIYLMHTICAAGLRAVLMKMDIFSPGIHIVLGLVISFAGPIVAAKAMEYTKMDVLVYPSKYIKV